MGGLDGLFRPKPKASVNESVTDISMLITGIDKGRIDVHGSSRRTLNADEVILLQGTYPEAVEVAREKGMIVEDTDDRSGQTVH